MLINGYEEVCLGHIDDANKANISLAKRKTNLNLVIACVCMFPLICFY